MTDLIRLDSRHRQHSEMRMPKSLLLKSPHRSAGRLRRSPPPSNNLTDKLVVVKTSNAAQWIEISGNVVIAD